MAIVDLVMPKLGESIMEATILHWSKKPGDHVKMDETVLEIATDKVDSEVPSTAEGVVEELLYNENDVVPIGTVIAKIRSENGVEEQTPPPAVATSEIKDEKEIKEVPYQPSYTTTTAPKTTGARFYSPLVLNIAANEGVNLSDLEKIPGTGNDGRVTKKDILQWIAAGKEKPIPETIEQPQAVAPVQQTTTPIQPATSGNAEEVTEPVYSGNVEVIEMDRMRKLIAKHMVDSKHTSAHVTSFTECDVTNMVLWREKVKVNFEKQEGEKLTFTPLFIEAIIKCIKKYPWLNASVDVD